MHGFDWFISCFRGLLLLKHFITGELEAICNVCLRITDSPFKLNFFHQIHLQIFHSPPHADQKRPRSFVFVFDLAFTLPGSDISKTSRPQNKSLMVVTWCRVTEFLVIVTLCTHTDKNYLDDHIFHQLKILGKALWGFQCHPKESYTFLHPLKSMGLEGITLLLFTLSIA